MIDKEDTEPDLEGVASGFIELSTEICKTWTMGISLENAEWSELDFV